VDLARVKAERPRHQARKLRQSLLAALPAGASHDGVGKENVAKAGHQKSPPEKTRIELMTLNGLGPAAALTIPGV
jgi:hypothetical protein